MCALVVREGRQHAGSDITYVGFEIPPAFVVGYGLDASEYGRNLPYIAEYLPGDQRIDAKRALRRRCVVAPGSFA